MKVEALQGNDPMARRLMRSRAAGRSTMEVEAMREVDTTLRVVVDSLWFVYEGPEQNYRPSVHVAGRLTEIELAGVHANTGIETLTFTGEVAPRISGHYVFDDEQLVELVRRGYFNKGFEPPSSLTGIAWELPAKMDALIISPEVSADPPLVFVTVLDQTQLRIDLSSGYSIEEWFPTVSSQAQLDAQAALDAERQASVAASTLGVSRAPVYGQSNLEEDLFAEEMALVDPRARAAREAAAAESQVPSGERLSGEAFLALLSETPEVAPEEEENLSLTPAELYEQLIGDSVDEGLLGKGLDDIVSLRPRDEEIEAAAEVEVQQEIAQEEEAVEQIAEQVAVAEQGAGVTDELFEDEFIDEVPLPVEPEGPEMPEFLPERRLVIETGDLEEDVTPEDLVLAEQEEIVARPAAGEAPTRSTDRDERQLD